MNYIKPDRIWSGSVAHGDDILALACLPGGLLATASFDGEIKVWSLENENLYVRLRKGRPQTQ